MSKRWLVLAIALAGCSNGSTTSGDGPSGGDQGVESDLSTSGGPGSPQDFLNTYYGVFLDKLKMCCSAVDMQTAQYQLGVALFQGFGGLLGRLLQSGADQGRLTFDSVAAAACIAQFKAAVSGVACSGDPLPMGQMLNACNAIFAGKQGAGMPCILDAECLDGLTCVGYVVSSNGGANSDGTCVTPPAGGQACSAGKADGGGSISFSGGLIFGNHPQCADGFYCDFMVCTARVMAGGQCSEDKQCAAGLTCHDGTCGMVGPSGAGSACKTGSDCMATLYCDTMIMKCANKKPAGQTCTGSFSSECLGRCSPPDGGTNGTCVPYCGSM